MPESTQAKMARMFRIVQQIGNQGRSEVLCRLCGYLCDNAPLADALDKILHREFPQQYEAPDAEGLDSGLRGSEK